MTKDELLQIISSNITDNNSGDITAEKLRNILNSMVEYTPEMENVSLDGYLYISTATPSTTPIPLTENNKVFYIATEEGDYSNFGLGTIGELSIIESENGSWKVEGLGVLLNALYCIINTADKNFYPARPNGTQKATGSFKGYKVDLNGLKERGIDAVKFQCSVYNKRDVLILANVYHKDGSISDIKEEDGDPKYSVQWKTLDIDDTMDYMIVTYGSAQLEEHTSHIFDPHVVYFLITDNSSSEIPDIPDISGLIGGSLKITNFEIVNYPARTNGEQKASGTFKGYKIDLSSYLDYEKVYFKGANGPNSQNISRGIIVDKGGNVEFYVPVGEGYTSGWQTLPITTNSSYLLASYPISDQYASIELWNPEYIELKSEGIADKVSELENRVELIEEKQNFESKVNVHLPSDIYILKNKTSQFFFRGFIEAVDPYIYDIKVKCAIGKTFRRYYEITPAQIGDYPFTIEIRDDNRNIIASATCTVHVVEKTGSTPTNKNILCVGDSATATGHWAAELKRMLADMSMGMSFKGRKTGTSDNSVLLEATGGWTWSTFVTSGIKYIRFQISSGSGDLTYGTKLTYGNSTYTVLEINITEGVGNIRCAGVNDYTSAVEPSSSSGMLTGAGISYEFSSYEMEQYVPFLNGDFSSYANQYSDGKIDYLIVHLGVNSMLWENRTIPEGDVKTFIDGYLADFPNGKIILTALPLPDYGTNVYANTYTDSNINRYGTLCNFLRYNDYLYNLTKDSLYSGKVYYCPSNMFFDTDYAYPKTEKNVNTRMTLKETIDTNGIHPVKEGSYLIADAIVPLMM